MELKEPPDPRREKLVPVVSYAVERRGEATSDWVREIESEMEKATL